MEDMQLAFGFARKLPRNIGTWEASFKKMMNDKNGSRVVIPIEITLVACNESTLKYEVKFNSYMCPKNPLNYTLKGGYFSSDFRYIEFRLRACDEGDCAEPDEVRKFLNEEHLHVFHSDSFTEASKNSSETIKTYMNDRYSMALD